MANQKLASALKFDYPQDQVPAVVASGVKEDAEFILQLAREFGIPIYEDPPLAQALVQLRIGTMIPPELYQAVAEVIAFVYRLDGDEEKIDQVLGPTTSPA